MEHDLPYFQDHYLISLASINMEQFPFPADVHLKAPPVSVENEGKVLELMNLMKQDGDFDELWCTEHTLTLFLIARNFNVDAAHDMMVFARGWRNMRKAHLVELQPNWVEKMGHESETGKIWCPGPDRWGRPVVIFDNTVQNTDSVDDQMLFLAWCLEFAIRDMPAHTDKYVVFMHLGNFSFFNNPPFAATKETAQMLCNCFPERAGHIVLYQPPFIFEAFYNSIQVSVQHVICKAVSAMLVLTCFLRACICRLSGQYLVDVKTRSKIVFIRGEDGAGTANHQKLVQIIGPKWRQITGAGKPPDPEQVGKYGPTSPGYDHDRHWRDVHRRIAARPAATRVYAADGKVIDNQRDRCEDIDVSAKAAAAVPGQKSLKRTGTLTNKTVLQSLNDSGMIDPRIYTYLENAHAPPAGVSRPSIASHGRSPSEVFTAPSPAPPASPNHQRRYKYCAPTLQ